MTVLEDLNPQRIWGNWRHGYSLDFHNVARKGERSDQKTALAQTLSWSDRAFGLIVEDLAEGILELLAFYGLKHDIIVPVPPSDGNNSCRILDICQAISLKAGTPVALLKKTRVASSLKGIKGFQARLAARQGLYALDSEFHNKSALVVDDVFATGATLITATSLLLEQGAAAVDVVTLTQTGGILWSDIVRENMQMFDEFSTNDDDAYLSDGVSVTVEGKLVDRG